MSTWYKKLTDYPENEINPFSEKAVLEIQTTKKRQAIRPPKTKEGENKYWVVDNSGQKVAESLFVREIEVDEEQFAKFFLSGLLNFWELSPRGIRVFTYVLRQLRPGRDEFYFSAPECMKYTLYKSRGLVISGLAELIGAGLVARSTDPLIYFVNPLILFNGSRVTFAKSYVRKKIQEKNPTQLELAFSQSLGQLKEIAKSLGI
jgi:hypothetical protein